MRLFATWMCVLLALSIAGQIFDLASGRISRTRTTVAIDAMLNIATLIWGFLVLNQS